MLGVWINPYWQYLSIKSQKVSISVFFILPQLKDTILASFICICFMLFWTGKYVYHMTFIIIFSIKRFFSNNLDTTFVVFPPKNLHTFYVTLYLECRSKKRKMDSYIRFRKCVSHNLIASTNATLSVLICDWQNMNP